MPRVFSALRELHKGRPETALASMLQSSAYGHGIKEIANNIGSALAEYGMTDEAIGYFEDARNLDEYYLTPRRNLVRIHEQKENWAQVEKLLQEIIVITPAPVPLLFEPADSPLWTHGSGHRLGTAISSPL